MAAAIAAPQDKDRVEVKNTTCYVCACDGEVRYIEGNPEHPLNQGVICAKGAAGIMKRGCARSIHTRTHGR